MRIRILGSGLMGGKLGTRQQKEQIDESWTTKARHSGP
jgi:hypothetical protein